MSLPDNMRDVFFNGKPYKLHSVTGRVLDTNTRSETEVHGSGGGGGGYTHQGTGYNATAPVEIESTTTRYTKIFLLDKEKNEHAVELVNFDVTCRTGNVLTLIWAIKQGKDRGPYIAAYNHNTRDLQFDNDSLYDIAKPGIYMWYAIGGAAVLLGLMYGIGGFIGGALLGAIGGAIVVKVIGNSQVKQFKGTQVPRVVEALKSVQHAEYVEHQPA